MKMHVQSNRTMRLSITATERKDSRGSDNQEVKYLKNSHRLFHYKKNIINKNIHHVIKNTNFSSNYLHFFNSPDLCFTATVKAENLATRIQKMQRESQII